MTGRTRRAAIAVLLGAGLLPSIWRSGAGGAEERKLSAAEIKKTLSGNTIKGIWAGRPYKQYFSESGSTLYAEEGRQPSMGRWKADTGKDVYCSWWEMSGWACYDVLDGGPDTIVWVSPSSGARYPAKVLPGKQL